MAKGDGRQAKAVPTTAFGQRLESEFLDLGYVSMADRERACSGFRPDLYPAKVPAVQIRQWMRGQEPRLGAVQILQAIGVDVHFCLTGQRSGSLAIRPVDGFDLLAYAKRVHASTGGAAISIRWTAKETLATIRYREGDGRRGDLPELYRTFERVMRHRAEVAGCNPITATPPHGVTDCSWLPEAELVQLAMWFQVWADDFGITRTSPPCEQVISAAPELQDAERRGDGDMVRTAVAEAWERLHLQQLRQTAYFLAWDPPVPREAAA